MIARERDHRLAQSDYWQDRAERAEQEAAANREDAERWRALMWADGEIVDGPKDKIESFWEFKPARYDGLDCNRYYMGSSARSLVECADFAVEQMNAARKESK